MTTITIPLPWANPPVSLNDRQHHHVKAKALVAAGIQAREAIRAAAPRPIVGADVTLHYRVATKRRRDADNLAGTLKVALDALVACGVLPDDSWIHVPSATCRIHPPDGSEPAMWLELDVLTDHQETP